MSTDSFSDNRITVVVTAYNAAKYIGRCIDTIINQDAEHCEIIVINDGSSDNTGEVIERYGARINLINNVENQGPAVGRTIGLHLANTEFVAFLDADDYWDSKFASTMKQIVLRFPDVVAANCSYIKRDYRGNNYYRPSLSSEDKEYYKEGNVCPDFYGFWSKYRSILTGSVLMRTSFAKLTGGQRRDLRLTQDLEFWGYLATFGKWTFLPEHLLITDERILSPKERLEKFKRRFSFFKGLDTDSWAKRIKPAIKNQESMASFTDFLKNIITTIAFSKAYLLDYKDSYRYTKENKDKLLSTGWGLVLKSGLRLGYLLWPAVCITLRLREYFKAYFYSILR